MSCLVGVATVSGGCASSFAFPDARPAHTIDHVVPGESEPDLLDALSPAHAAAAAAILPYVRAAASSTGVPEDFILAVMFVESRFQPEATSPVGARGLMQLMPRTAAALAEDLGLAKWDAYDPAFNALAGATYLARLIHRFEGDFRLALAAYNAGPTRVSRWRAEGRTLPGEVRTYVSRVLLTRERLASPEWLAALEEHHDAAGLEDMLRASPTSPGE